MSYVFGSEVPKRSLAHYPRRNTKRVTIWRRSSSSSSIWHLGLCERFIIICVMLQYRMDRTLFTFYGHHITHYSNVRAQQSVAMLTGPYPYATWWISVFGNQSNLRDYATLFIFICTYKIWLIRILSKSIFTSGLRAAGSIGSLNYVPTYLPTYRLYTPVGNSCRL